MKYYIIDLIYYSNCFYIKYYIEKQMKTIGQIVGVLPYG